jgi:hypothetical protein
MKPFLLCSNKLRVTSVYKIFYDFSEHLLQNQYSMLEKSLWMVITFSDQFAQCTSMTLFSEGKIGVMVLLFLFFKQN